MECMHLFSLCTLWTPIGIEESLVFACHYSHQIWSSLMCGLLRHNFVSDWDHLLQLLSDTSRPYIECFLLRYAFQATLYHVWRERNNKRHGEQASTSDRLILLIDKNIWNRANTTRREDSWYMRRAWSPGLVAEHPIDTAITYLKLATTTWLMNWIK